MTITIEAYTGTETVSTTEHSMTTDTAGPDVDTTAGVYAALIDLNAVAAGDVFEFRVYEKARTGDTQRLLAAATFANVQPTPLWGWTAPCPLGIGWDMTLIKISGTDRALNWRISKLA